MVEKRGEKGKVMGKCGQRKEGCAGKKPEGALAETARTAMLSELATTGCVRARMYVRNVCDFQSPRS